ncbi:MAG TPA: hypothetical protein VG871_04985 [Vicinamibacterales bacterium]|nr:hypothetical protein [Vicinamibacterales bacterium]
MPPLSPLGKAAVIAAVAFFVFAATIAVLVAVVVPLSEQKARERLVDVLAQRLDAKVELRELHLRTFPALRADGVGLTIRHRGRTDVPPLITIARFSAQANIFVFIRRHITRVDIEGLDIQIPPERHGSDDNVAPSDARQEGEAPHGDFARTLIVDHLYTKDARLTIIPSAAGKSPRVWNIHDLQMTSVSAGTAMPFDATLTNAVPPGEIATHGSFGPWQPDEPGETPLAGTFAFDRADLGVFPGISGILTARGQFGGRLERIDVHGETSVPEFRVVKTGGHPVPLHTTYHAIVDGTNGNTLLDDIHASFLDTALVAKGGVVGAPGRPGRTLSLDVSIDRGRLEDVLKLSVPASTPPMTGALRLKTTMVIPPGQADVVRRMRLKGRFTLSGSRFTSDTVQKKIAELSHRGQGKPEKGTDGAAHVQSTFSGDFSLAGGTLSLPDVGFAVPGALVQLSGTYAMERETIDFAGMLYMDAKVSDTTTGIKHVLLKIIDPLFRRDGGGSAIPIKITGTRSDPSFGLDKGRLFSHRHQPSHKGQP